MFELEVNGDTISTVPQPVHIVVTNVSQFSYPPLFKKPIGRHSTIIVFLITDETSDPLLNINSSSRSDVFAIFNRR